MKMWISQGDFLVRRITDDKFIAPAELRAALERYWLSIGRSGRFGSKLEAALARGESDFTVTTFHPRCNEPIPAEAFRPAAGSL